MNECSVTRLPIPEYFCCFFWFSKSSDTSVQRFDKSLEEFYALCDQLELCLVRLAIKNPSHIQNTDVLSWHTGVPLHLMLMVFLKTFYYLTYLLLYCYCGICLSTIENKGIINVTFKKENLTKVLTYSYTGKF